MKLYWGPHTCAIGIHILLEEIGRPYETERIDVQGGATHEPWFTAINPKGKVPTLIRDDGSVLTEFTAIAWWLARTNPDAELIADGAEGEARTLELMDYVEGTIHGQGFGRIFMPDRFEPQDVVHQTVPVGRGSVKAQGKQMVEEAFAILAPQLEQHDYTVSDRFTIADAALFYVERWAPSVGITLPPVLQQHFERLVARPAVQTVRTIWGES